MKLLKVVAIVAVAYIALVVVFESLLGYFQPTAEGTLVIRVTGPDGDVSQRVLARIESAGQLYVAVNHWPRAWYHTALENPQVQVAHAGETRNYQATEVSDEEFRRVDGEHPRSLGFKFLTGFPPREILRLDPR